MFIWVNDLCNINYVCSVNRVLYVINNSDNNLWCVSFYSLITGISASLNGFSTNKTSSYFTVLRFLKIRNWIKPKIVTAKKIIIQTTISEVTYAGLRNCSTIYHLKLINFSDFGDRMKMTEWWQNWCHQVTGIFCLQHPCHTTVTALYITISWEQQVRE